MSDILFVVKIAVVTLVMIFLMQIKIGDDTLENQALMAMRESTFAGHLQELGTGGWKELRKNIAGLARMVGDTVGSHSGDRLNFFKLGRSGARLDEEARSKEEAAALRGKEGVAADRAGEEDVISQSESGGISKIRKVEAEPKARVDRLGRKISSGSVSDETEPAQEQ